MSGTVRLGERHKSITKQGTMLDESPLPEGVLANTFTSDRAAKEGGDTEQSSPSRCGSPESRKEGNMSPGLKKKGGLGATIKITEVAQEDT